MNIIEAAKQMGPGKILISEDGFTAKLDDLGFLICTSEEGEPFGFFVEELLSEKWTVEEENKCEN